MKNSHGNDSRVQVTRFPRVDASTSMDFALHKYSQVLLAGKVRICVEICVEIFANSGVYLNNSVQLDFFMLLTSHLQVTSSFSSREFMYIINSSSSDFKIFTHIVDYCN